jgi:hypothetical protein
MPNPIERARPTPTTGEEFVAKQRLPWMTAVSLCQR